MYRVKQATCKLCPVDRMCSQLFGNGDACSLPWQVVYCEGDTQMVVLTASRKEAAESAAAALNGARDPHIPDDREQRMDAFILMSVSGMLANPKHTYVPSRVLVRTAYEVFREAEKHREAELAQRKLREQVPAETAEGFQMSPMPFAEGE